MGIGDYGLLSASLASLACCLFGKPEQGFERRQSHPSKMFLAIFLSVRYTEPKYSASLLHDAFETHDNKIELSWKSLPPTSVYINLGYPRGPPNSASLFMLKFGMASTPPGFSNMQQMSTDHLNARFTQNQYNKLPTLSAVNPLQTQQQPPLVPPSYLYEHQDFMLSDPADYIGLSPPIYYNTQSLGTPNRYSKPGDMFYQFPQQRAQAAPRVPSLGMPQTYMPVLGDHRATASTKTSKSGAVYPCRICGKVFPKPYNLKSHQKTHSNEKPFPCKYCSKPFARSHDRRRHEKLHENDKKLKCGGLLSDGKTTWGCNRKFARPDALRRHFRTDTGVACIRPLMLDFRNSKQVYEEPTEEDTEQVINDIAREAAIEALSVNNNRAGDHDTSSPN
ncbi:hypothetical protein KL928_003891 [Ogataea angusta]|uniref:C2H2-type domain-containing protein n=1 Tax=Pichia angusta TaxID=870730 RepID=A0AAN6DCT2_PICAN|nr:uncharacterized protein KL928_003891 [Ogataea angusta]KAG7817156.1 hypothetical protein KL928_003891 [Ogataea angusta]